MTDDERAALAHAADELRAIREQIPPQATWFLLRKQLDALADRLANFAQNPQ